MHNDPVREGERNKDRGDRLGKVQRANGGPERCHQPLVTCELQPGVNRSIVRRLPQEQRPSSSLLTTCSVPVLMMHPSLSLSLSVCLFPSLSTYFRLRPLPPLSTLCETLLSAFNGPGLRWVWCSFNTVRHLLVLSLLFYSISSSYWSSLFY